MLRRAGGHRQPRGGGDDAVGRVREEVAGQQDKVPGLLHRLPGFGLGVGHANFEAVAPPRCEQRDEAPVDVGGYDGVVISGDNTEYGEN